MAKYKVLMSIATIRMTGKQMNEAVRILDKYGWEKLSPFMETWQIEMERDKKTEVFFEVQQNVAEIMREVGVPKLGYVFQITRTRPYVCTMTDGKTGCPE